MKSTGIHTQKTSATLIATVIFVDDKIVCVGAIRGYIWNSYENHSLKPRSESQNTEYCRYRPGPAYVSQTERRMLCKPDISIPMQHGNMPSGLC